MVRKLFFAVMLSVCAFCALALPKPSEVKSAFTSGNYALAEDLLKQVMVEKPTAMVHYQLGQVYAAEGKHLAALNEYRQAQALDPTLKFASSATAFTQLVSNEQQLVTPPPSIARSVTVVNTVPTSTPYSGPSAMSVFGVLFTFAFIAIVIAAIVHKRKKMAKEAEAEAELSEKKNALLALAKDLEDAVLIAKTSNHTDAMKTRLLDNISIIQSRIRTGLSDLKDAKDVSASRMQALTESTELAVSQAANGIPAPAKSQYVHNDTAPETGYVRDLPRRNSNVSGYRSPSPAPSPNVVHHYREPVHVVQNNNNDLLTGVLIGEAMSNHRDHTVYVDRNSGFDQPRGRSDTYVETTTYIAPPAPAPVFDEPYRSPSPAPSDDSWGSSSSNSIDSSSPGDDSY